MSVYDMTSHDSITCSSTHLSTFMVLFEDVIVELNPVERILTYIIYAVCGAISAFVWRCASRPDHFARKEM